MLNAEITLFFRRSLKRSHFGIHWSGLASQKRLKMVETMQGEHQWVGSTNGKRPIRFDINGEVLI